ncbi:MAG: hypothetical protein ACPGTO_07855 [Polaribacter sp.]
MKNKRIDFNSIEWERPSIGVEQKQFLNGNQRIRLLRFYDDFVEEDWCAMGHIGYVNDGEMTINFNGSFVQYKKGDGLWIENGENYKHKVVITKGKFVELIIFEIV